jgi:hypothetical protein
LGQHIEGYLQSQLLSLIFMFISLQGLVDGRQDVHHPIFCGLFQLGRNRVYCILFLWLVSSSLEQHPSFVG